MQINWLSYQFHICLPGASFKDIPGIYIFTGLNHAGKWAPLYIGQTNSFKNRLPSHERWREAAGRGATHIHAMTVLNQNDRDMVESLLIKTYEPPLNVQLK